MASQLYCLEPLLVITTKLALTVVGEPDGRSNFMLVVRYSNLRPTRLPTKLTFIASVFKC